MARLVPDKMEPAQAATKSPSTAKKTTAKKTTSTKKTTKKSPSPTTKKTTAKKKPSPTNSPTSTVASTYKKVDLAKVDPIAQVVVSRQGAFMQIHTQVGSATTNSAKFLSQLQTDLSKAGLRAEQGYSQSSNVSVTYVNIPLNYNPDDIYNGVLTLADKYKLKYKEANATQVMAAGTPQGMQPVNIYTNKVEYAQSAGAFAYQPGSSGVTPQAVGLMN